LKGEDNLNNEAASALRTLIDASTMVSTMAETAQARNETKIIPSKRKRAYPEKKAKRKMVQASRRRNRK